MAFDWKEIMAELTRQGWKLEPTTKRHMKATPPDKAKQIVHFSTSGSESTRSMQNSLGQLRKSGFVWSKRNDENEERDVYAEVDRLPRAEVEAMLDGAPTGPDVVTIGSNCGAPPESEEAKLDVAYAALKDSRVWLTLSEHDFAEAEEVVRAATAKLADARAQLYSARRSMKERKRDFDAVMKTGDEKADEEALLANEPENRYA